MTVKNWSAHIVASLFVMASPSLHGQDFLKQLEAKLSQKQQDAKSKESSNEKSQTKESGAEPFLLPSVLEPNPANSATPSLLKAQDEKEGMELPAPKVEPKAPAPKKTQRPTPAPAVNPAGNPTAPADKAGPTANRSLQSPFTKPSVKSSSQPASPAGGGFLGLTVEAIPGGGFGLTIVDVAADSPAWRAGFRNGDKVVGVAGQAVSTVDTFAEQLARFAPGAAVKFLVDRRGTQANLVAVLQDRRVAGQIHGTRPGTVSQLEPDVAALGGRPGPAYLGINVSDMSEAYRRQFSIPAYRGASVTEVVPNSPAHSAGIRPGDCIIEIEGTTVQTADIVFETITRSKPGQVISISFYRGRLLNNASIQLISASDNDGRTSPNAIGPEMLTPEYVATLQNELERVHAELSDTQARLQQLEARLQQVEKKR
jgi:S1-C subfamily serine protease